MTPLSRGRLSWVLGPDADTPAHRELATRAADRLVTVAAQLTGGRAGWEHEGLEFTHDPDGTVVLDGFAENDQVSFLLSLGARPGRDETSADAFEVEAEIAVRCDCDTLRDHGMHRIEQRVVGDLASPLSVLDALDILTAWIAQRAREVSPTDWRNLRNPGD